MQRRRTVIAGVIAAAVGLMAAGPASAATFRGTVVHKNRSVHKFVVATKSGRLVVVRSNRAPAIGRVVRVSGTKTRSGIFSARSIRSVGRARHARLRGVVTYTNRSKRLFTVSTRGASVLIHQRRLRGRSARAAADTMPSSGEQVAVDTTIDQNDDLEADNVQNQGQATSGIELQGKVLAVDQTARTIQVSGDDDEQSGGAVTVSIPSSFDITQFKVGNEVELTVAKQSDNSFVLQSIGDENDTADENDNNDGENGNNTQNKSGDQKSGGNNGDNGNGGD
jgi:hypothetical protein